MWYFRKIAVVMLMLVSCINTALAQKIVNLSEGEAKTIKSIKEIASVFIADPEIADYQVIDANKVVVFGKKIGSTSIIVFDENGDTITNNKLVINKSLVHIQQQIQLKYPNADVTIYNVGDQVVLSGIVSTEQEKDDINIIVGELLNKKSDDYIIQWESTGTDTKYEMEFMKRRHFAGIVNNIEVAAVKQVNVKLSIAEVSHSFLENFGIEYSSIGQTSGTFVNLVTKFSASDIASVITAIADDSVGQILAEPNLSVISGESASFLVGGELPVVTG